jgi:uncharacterized protein (TIGR02118 family)
MLKFVMVIRRRADVTPEEFHRYWLEEHGPLARRLLEPLNLRRYVQVHTLDTPLNGLIAASRGTTEAFDGIAELWFDSLEALLTAFNTEEGARANAALVEDEAKFIDLSRSSTFVTKEHVIFGAATPG